MMPTSHLFADAVLLPMTQEAQRFATEFAREQPTPEKARQVYFNTLAVCAVNNYLRILDIPTNLTAGDSWNAIVRLAADVADLCVTGVGRLECRPVLSATETRCPVPVGIQDQRIGCVVVQIDLDQQEAWLLGCLAAVPAHELRLGELHPMSELLEYLELASAQTVNLSQWWQGLVTAGWDAIEAVSLAFLPPAQIPQVAFRRSLTNQMQRVKFRTLRSDLTVMLVVTLTQANAAQFGIQLQLMAQSSQQPLPAELTLSVLDDRGSAFIELAVADATSAASEATYSLQTRQFSGQIGEPFQVRIECNELIWMEAFVI